MKNLRTTSKRLAIVALLTIAATATRAQSGFHYSAAIGTVDTDGFYRIDLKPALMAKTKADLSDLRIVDLKGRFVRYITPSWMAPQEKLEFVDFPIVNRTADSVTSVEVKANRQVSFLWLKLKNTTVDRSINLAGSEDQKTWFAIAENIPLQHATAIGQTDYLQSLDFPPSSYKYLRISISNKNKSPVDITNVGIFTSEVLAMNNVPVPSPKIEQKDTGQISRITLRFDDAYQVNKLHLTIAGAKFFKRDVSIYEQVNGRRKLIDNVELNSAKSTDLRLSAKAKTLVLEINNDDNPPLQVTAVDAFQLEESIITYLEKGHFYNLITGNDTAHTPVYDLKVFADSLNQGVRGPLYYGPVKEIVANRKVAIKDGHKNPWVLWGSIAAALLVLSFLTVKMTSEINRRQNNNS